jgi:hypothetical protein
LPAGNTPTAAAPDTIVLIHGLWVTPRSWEKWIERYEGRGYRVLAPAYPGFEVEVEALNEDPSPIRSSWPLGRRLLYPGPARSRLWGSRRSHRLRAGRVTPVSQIRSLFPILKNRKPPQSRGLHPRAVPLCLHHNPQPRGVGQGLPALPHPSAGQLRVGRAPCQLHTRSPGCLRQLQKRRPGTAAVHSRRRRQPHASSGQPIKRQALPHQLGHRL